MVLHSFDNDAWILDAQRILSHQAVMVNGKKQYFAERSEDVEASIDNISETDLAPWCCKWIGLGCEWMMCGWGEVWSIFYGANNR